MPRRIVILLVAGAALLGGCGGSSSNGEADKTAAQILADAKQAVRDAGSVKVAGTITEQGQSIGLDLTSGRDGGTGTMTLQGSKIDIVRVGKAVFLRAPAAFYENLGAGAGAGQLLDRKWLKAPATDKNFKDLAQLTDVDRFAALALKPDGTVTKGSETTIDGQKAIELKSSKGGSLYVATTGKPYPLRLESSGTTKGKLVLSDWGAKVEAKAPEGAIDLSKLGG